MRRAKVFSGSSHPELSDYICEKLGISPSPVTLKKFSNRETSVEIGCSVRNEDVFVIQSGSTHINDHLMELLIMISACKGASASRITAVMPYFPYSKQSKKKNHRGAITAKMVANLLSVAGVDHIITMDLHASQMQGFFNKPVDNLFAEPSIAKWIRDSVPEYITNGVVVSKNAGGAKRVTSLADRLKIDFALIHTDRTRGRHHHHNSRPDSLSSSTNLESPINNEPLEKSENQSNGDDDDVDDDDDGNDGNDDDGNNSSIISNGYINSSGINKGYCYHTSNTTSDHITTAIINGRLSVDDEDDGDDGEYAAVKSSGTSVTGEILSMDEVDLTASTSSINNHNGSSSGCSVCNSSTITLVGDVAGKVAFIIDDMIDKAGSFIAAAEHLMMKCNAKRVYVIATHGILSGDSLNEIEKCKSIYQLVITNSFPVPQEKLLKSSKLVIIDVSATLAEAIRRTHNGESISYLFYTPL